MINKPQKLNRQAIISMKSPIQDCGLPLVTFNCGDVPVTFLIDTGSTHCLIDSKVLETIPHNVDDSQEFSMYGVDGKIAKKKRASLELWYKKYRVYSGNFTITELKFPKEQPDGSVVDESLFDGILGLEFLIETSAKINYGTFKVYVNGLSRDEKPKVQAKQDLSSDDVARQLEILEQAEESAIRL